MKKLKLEMTVEELLLVTSLMSDQLFRREFIDPKMPGYRGDPAEVAMGKDVVLRLKTLIREASDSYTNPMPKRAPSAVGRNPNGFHLPFEQCSRQSFTLASIRAYAPSVSGIYGLSNAREWIYIGETDNIQASLLNELQQVDSALLSRGPTEFVFELCAPDARPSRQDRLVLECEPVFNRRRR